MIRRFMVIKYKKCYGSRSVLYKSVSSITQSINKFLVV